MQGNMGIYWMKRQNKVAEPYENLKRRKNLRTVSTTRNDDLSALGQGFEIISNITRPLLLWYDACFSSNNSVHKYIQWNLFLDIFNVFTQIYEL